MPTIGESLKRLQTSSAGPIYRVWFRPRVLRDVGRVDYSSSIFGFKTSMPVYITATALGMSTPDSSHSIDIPGKLGHPQGEVCLTKAAAEHDVIQMVSRSRSSRDHL